MINKNIQTPDPISSPEKREQETEIISGSEILIRSLLAEGVDTMFGYRVVPLCQYLMPCMITNNRSNIYWCVTNSVLYMRHKVMHVCRKRWVWHW